MALPRGDAKLYRRHSSVDFPLQRPSDIRKDWSTCSNAHRYPMLYAICELCVTLWYLLDAVYAIVSFALTLRMQRLGPPRPFSLSAYPTAMRS